MDRDEAGVDHPVLGLTGVGKVYGSGESSVVALSDVTLSVDHGEYVAVMGPSGSGKSTLMHILGCLDVPSSGTYRLAGENVAELRDGQLAELRNRRIGVVFQSFNLIPRVSAVDNVELPLVYARVPSTLRRRRCLAALEAVGLSERARHRPSELSGGQQQRVAIARALVNDPVLVLADEPTGALDSASAEEVMLLLDQLNADGRTVVVITHEEAVAAHARRVVRVRDGRVVSDEWLTGAGSRIRTSGGWR